MSILDDYKFLTFLQASTLVPSKPHANTLWRWATAGVRGKKLKSYLLGGQRFTTKEDVEDFLFGDTPAAPITSQRSRIKRAEKTLGL